MFVSTFQDIPFTWLFVLTFIILLIAFECGMILGNKYQENVKEADRSSISSIVAAKLGLLAFLLTFTFGIAASKYDEKRALVLEEANAIGTTFLRAGYLPNLHKTEIRSLLKQYVDVRLNHLNPIDIAKGIELSQGLQDKLWHQAEAIAEKTPDSVVAGLFIQSLNDVIDLHTKRLNIGLRIRIPSIIWTSLYFVAVIAFGTVGYQIGLMRARYMGIILLLITTFSLVLVLIADLDRPQAGFIKVSQQPLQDLQRQLQK